MPRYCHFATAGENASAFLLAELIDYLEETPKQGKQSQQRLLKVMRMPSTGSSF